MARYTDVDALCKRLLLMAERYNALGQVRVTQDYNWAVTLLDGAPTEDVAPVRYGKWQDVVRYNDGERMIATRSCCKERGELRTTRTEFGLWVIDSPCCPNCGARMDGDKE